MYTKDAPILDRLRILCVDDDERGLRVRQVLLEREGHVVIIVTEPAEALEHDLSLFDLALLDYDMPEMNGRDLLLRMRAAKVSCPIVLLSGQAWTLPNEVRVLFSACINKGGPVREMLEIVDRFRRRTDVKGHA